MSKEIELAMCPDCERVEPTAMVDVVCLHCDEGTYERRTFTTESTPNEDLWALVEEWREFAEPDGWDQYSNGVRDATESCANELAEILEE